MRNYRLMLDISDVFPRIRHLFLKIYNSPFPTVFVSADNPDEACFTAFNDLINIIMKQNSSVAMRLICREIIRKCRVDKVEEL